MSFTEQQSGHCLGVIEAFYGKVWTPFDRFYMIEQLAMLGYRDYVFGPKAETKLRKDWRVLWTDEELSELVLMCQHAKSQGMSIGIGFSPMGLRGIAGVADREALKNKIKQIDLLGVDQLCILFDDMNCYSDRMAVDQLESIDYIVNKSSALSFTICPSYYSTDLVLEKVFGAMPKNYWRELGCGLDSGIDFFWTGEKVCSDQFCKDNLDFIANEFRRLPSIWDNYPVNDGEKKSQYLYLRPFENRFSWLADYSTKHYANPMNQPRLSLLSLSTLPKVYEQKNINKDASERIMKTAWKNYIENTCSEFTEVICNDSKLFQSEGLLNMGAELKAEKLHFYSNQKTPFATEVAGWLSGEYAFDPECLTD